MSDEPFKRGRGRPRKPVVPKEPISLEERRRRKTTHTKARMDELEAAGLTIRTETDMRRVELTPDQKAGMVAMILDKEIWSFAKLAEECCLDKAMLYRIRQRDPDWDAELKRALSEVSLDKPRTMMGAAVDAGINTGGNISMPQYLAGVTLLRHEDPGYGDKAQMQVNVGVSAEQVGQLVREMTSNMQVQELIKSRTAKLIGTNADEDE